MIERVAHCDWSKDAEKRWMAIATFRDGRYSLSRPQLVGDVSTLFHRLRNGLDDQARLLVGFDFPIGVPSAYAVRANVGDFRQALPQFGAGQWQAFYDKCRVRADISVNRPFYPFSCKTKGAAKHEHLTEALGLTWNDLFRACERKSSERNAACPLFWTLGGNQVGSAAIAGWRDLLTPELARPGHSIGLWPFDGDWQHLLGAYRTIIAETYPAEAYRHIGLPSSGWSKRKQTARRDLVSPIFRWTDSRPLVFDDGLRELIQDGFGLKGDGEDQFDAFIGVCSMIDVALGNRTDGAPNSSQIRQLEGWILGQQPQT